MLAVVLPLWLLIHVGMNFYYGYIWGNRLRWPHGLVALYVVFWGFRATRWEVS